MQLSIELPDDIAQRLRNVKNCNEFIANALINALDTIQKKPTTLNDLLAGTPQERLVINEEDRAWLNAKPVGKERL